MTSSKHQTLRDLALHQLRDVYDAERHVAKLLPKMAKAAAADTVRQALGKRHDETLARIDRLDAIFEHLDKKPHHTTCEAMHGIVAETKTLLDDYADSPAIDAGLLGAASAIDHYALARYGTLRLWAHHLGLAEVATPIAAILAETRTSVSRWDALADSVPTDGAATSPLTLKQAALMGLR